MDDNLKDLLRSGEEAASRAQGELSARPDRAEMRRTAFAAAVVASVVMCAVAILVSILAYSAASASNVRAGAAQQSSEDNQKLAQQAYDAAEDANRVLTSRGQQPVSVPQPDDSDPTDTLVSAAVARVLALLPVSANAQQLGEGVAAYMVANPITPQGPSPAQVIDGVAAYLRDNPPPPGAPGATGERGDPGRDGTDGEPGKTPTQADIQAAFVAYVNEHPEALRIALCGKDFEEARNLLAADGRQYTLYGCVIAVQEPTATEPPVSTTSTTGG